MHVYSSAALSPTPNSSKEPEQKNEEGKPQIRELAEAEKQTKEWSDGVLTEPPGVLRTGDVSFSLETL